MSPEDLVSYLADDSVDPDQLGEELAGCVAEAMARGLVLVDCRGRVAAL